jgi:hypothetical protein
MLPDWMTEWWFLGLMLGLLCFFVILGVLLLVFSIVLASRKRQPPDDRERFPTRD